jgi:hypothetical protein
MLTRDGPVLVEINPRLVGARIARMVSAGLQRSIHADLIALHVEGQLPPPVDRAHYVTNRWLAAPCAGQLTHLDIPDTADEPASFTMMARVGDMVTPPLDNADRLGMAMTWGTSAPSPKRGQNNCWPKRGWWLRPSSTRNDAHRAPATEGAIGPRRLSCKLAGAHMIGCPAFEMIRRRYAQSFGADLVPSFEAYRGHGTTPCKAALGFRRAAGQRLFLECYLDEPIESLASAALGRQVTRESIVEIGNFAADNALSMIALWGTVSNDLAQDCDLAVATLTLPLRRMFRRVGIPFQVLGGRASPPATRERSLGRLLRPCATGMPGEIAKAQQAIADFMAPRHQVRAA